MQIKSCLTRLNWFLFKVFACLIKSTMILMMVIIFMT